MGYERQINQGNCPNCEKSLAEKRFGAKFCDSKCAQNYKYHQRKVRKVKNCLWCNSDISNQYAATRYCIGKDPDCANQANYSKLFYDGACLNCNKNFKSKRKGSQFCTIACVNSCVKSHHDLICLKCEYCSNLFLVVYIDRDRKFCTQSCVSRFINEHRDNDLVNQKISEAHKRNYENGYIHPWVGRKHSEETKQKLVKSLTGLMSGEKNPMWGKHHTVESREKISNLLVKRIEAGNTGFVKGKFISKKAGKEVYYRSFWEKQVLEYFEKENNIIFFDVEPFYISYEFNDNGTKVNKNYIPDFLVVYNNGKKIIYELKPDRLSQFDQFEINRLKFEAGNKYCELNSMEFIWVTEKNIENIFPGINFKIQNR